MPPLFSKPQHDIDELFFVMSAGTLAVQYKDDAGQTKVRHYEEHEAAQVINIEPSMLQDRYVFAKWKPFSNKVAMPVQLCGDIFIVLDMRCFGVAFENKELAQTVSDIARYSPKIHFNGRPWNDTNYCAYCGLECVSTKNKCSQCHLADLAVYYCSRECQMSDWPNHKDFCYRDRMKRFELLVSIIDCCCTDLTEYFVQKKTKVLAGASAQEVQEIEEFLDRIQAHAQSEQI